MGVFNADGSWTSNSGTTYGPDTTFDQYAPADKAEFDADFTKKAPGGGEGTQAKFGDVGGFLEGIAGGLGMVPQRVTDAAPGATLDVSQADESRAGMDGLLAQLTQQAATGDGDWQTALKAATQRTQSTAQALGQSNPSMDAGGAAMNIGNAQAGAAQRGAGQEKTLRAQSQAAGQGMLADLLASQGKQDFEQANAAARARQQVSATNLALIDEAQKNATNVKSGISSAMPMSDGGEVPGTAQVFGNDERNDTKPAMLSPGEIVVDREHAQDPYSAAMRAFQIAMEAQGGAPKMAEGGGIDQYDTKDYGEGNAALSVILPSIGQAAGYGNLRGKAGAGPPTIDNGGKLDSVNFDASRNATLGLAKTIGGPRMSAAPQMVTNAADDAIAAGLANRSASGAANVMAGVGAQQQGAGGNAAAQAGNEQARAQGLQGSVLSGQRGRDLSMALGQQQAGWANTMSNLGISLANQAALRGLFSGAGQAMTAASGAGSEPKYGGYSSPGIEADAMGERGGPADLGASDPDFKAEGGMIDGYAKGGRVEGKVPRLPQPKDRTHVNLRIGDVELSPRAETREERKAAEYEEEVGDPMPAKRPKTAPATEKTLAQKLAEFAQQATGAVSKMAGGGAMPYGGYDPAAAFALPQQIPNSPAGVQLPPPGRPFVPPGFVSTQNGLAPTPNNETPMNFSAPPGGGGPFGTPELAMVRESYDAEQGRKQLGITARGEAQAAPDQSPPPPTPAPRTGGGIGIPQPDAMGRAFVNNEQQLANEQMGEAAAAAARAEVAGVEAKQNAAQAAELRMKETHDRARMRTDEAMAKWQAAQDEFNRIDTRVDAGRYWADKSTGQKILGILGLALGAMGTGPDGINKSAQLMNQAIDRDVQLQKEAVERRLRGGAQRIEGAKTYYAMAREAGMDDLAATQAAKAAGAESAALAADRMQAATKEPTAKAMYAQFGAALHGAAFDNNEKAKQLTFENRLKAQHVANETAAVGAKGGSGEGERKALHDAEANAQDSLDLIRTIKSSLGKTQSIVPGVTAVRQNYGDEAPNIETATTQLTLKLKDMAKLGQISNTDQALLDKLIGDPQAVWGKGSTEESKTRRLDALEAIVTRSIKNQRGAAAGGLAQ